MIEKSIFKTTASWRIFAVLLAVMLLLAGCYQPSARFVETEFDFGETPQKTTLRHTFTFRNEGKAPLRIDKIHSG